MFAIPLIIFYLVFGSFGFGFYAGSLSKYPTLKWSGMTLYVALVLLWPFCLMWVLGRGAGEHEVDKRIQEGDKNEQSSTNR